MTLRVARMHAWTAPEVPQLDPLAERPRLRLFDTAQQQLVPAGPGRRRRPARFYVCGITPYDATHIGHANTYVAFDLLNRVWRDAGLDVDYVQNVTDVDDPLLERAIRDGIDWQQLAADQTELFRTDMAALNVIPPAHYVGAVESIGEVVELIGELQEKGRSTPSTTPSTRTSTSPGPPTPTSVRCPTSTDAEALSLSSPSGAATRTDRASRIRWTVWSGDCNVPTSRAGTPRWGGAGRAGTSSAPRSR